MKYKKSVTLEVFFMSRKERFTPQEKEQACIDYVENFIFRLVLFNIGQPYITNMVLQDLQRKLKILLIQNNLRLKLLKNIYVVKHHQLN